MSEKYIKILKENDSYIFSDREMRYSHAFSEKELRSFINAAKKLLPKKIRITTPFLGHDMELGKMFTDKNKHIRIVALYIKAKKIQLNNRDRLKSVIIRNSRAAILLNGYSLKRIIEVMQYLNKTADYKWTLETVGKFIDTDLNKFNTFSNQPKKALGEFEVK